MSRRAVRQQLGDYLVQCGPVEDPSGRATAKFRAAVGYDGSEAAFSQLIASMARAGQLTREIKGKRTYRITTMAPSPNTSTGQDPPALASESVDQADMDYDELASALLVQVVQALSKEGQAQDRDGSWARRRMVRLERHIDELERELAQARAESKALASERDQLQLRLEHSDSNLAVLTERLGGNTPRGTTISKGLGFDERALLTQLQTRGTTGPPERAS